MRTYALRCCRCGSRRPSWGDVVLVRHERVAATVESLLANAAGIPAEQRGAAHWYLAMASPVLGYWVRWNARFPVLFVVGVLAGFGALMALAFQRPLVAYAFVLVGLVLLATAGVRLWRISSQALDMAIGACLPAERITDARREARQGHDVAGTPGQPG